MSTNIPDYKNRVAEGSYKSIRPFEPGGNPQVPMPDAKELSQQ
jgi:hypothetical protein